MRRIRVRDVSHAERVECIVLGSVCVVVLNAM